MPRTGHSHNAMLVVYHSVNEYSEDRVRIPNIVTPVVFEAQIKYLASIGRMISLQEYLEHHRTGKPLLQKSIIVTFDDGYKDNLTTAAPILQKYGVPATFFIATGCIGADQIKWEDRLSCLVRRSKAGAVSLALPGGEITFGIGDDKEKFKSINTLVNLLGHHLQAERLQMLEELEHELNVKCDDRAGVMMTWADVRQLASMPGFSIGSHAVTHQHLTRLPLGEVKLELTGSKARLESELGCPVTAFSYPYGDYNLEVATAVKNAGYVSAGTIEYGQNSIQSDPFRLKRVLVPNQQGARFQLGIRLRGSAVGEFLRQGYNFVSQLRQPTPARMLETRRSGGER